MTNKTWEDMALEDIRESNPNAYAVLSKFYQDNKRVDFNPKGVTTYNIGSGMRSVTKNIDRGMIITVEAYEIEKELPQKLLEISEKGFLSLGNINIPLRNLVTRGVEENRVKFLVERWGEEDV